MSRLGLPPLNLGFMPGFGRPPANVEDYAPTPEEQQTWLGKTAGGLEGAANVLDYPGSLLRGGLYGAFTGDYSGVNPGNVKTSEGRKYGADFLDAAGWKEPETWAGQENETFNPFNQSQNSAWLDSQTYINSLDKLFHKAGGLGIDIATDPLTLLGIGGKTAQGLAKVAEVGKAADAAKAAALEGSHAGLLEGVEAGKFAKNLASTPQTVANDLRSGDRALLGLHAPFWWPKAWGNTGAVKPIWGSGGFGGDTAAKLATGLGYIAPTRAIRGLISDKVSPAVSTFDQSKQMVNDAVYAHLDQLSSNVNAASQGFSASYGKLEGELAEMVKHLASNGDVKSAQDIMRGLSTDPEMAVKGVGSNLTGAANPMELAGTVLDSIKRETGQATPNVAMLAQLNDWTKRFSDYHYYLEKFKDVAFKQANEYGIPIEELRDAYVQHMPRFSSLKHTGEDVRPERMRHEAARDVVGGEPAINAAAMNKLANGYVEPGADMSRFKGVDPKGELYDQKTGRVKGALWKALLSENLGIQSPYLDELRAFKLYKDHFAKALDEAWDVKDEAYRNDITKNIIPHKDTGEYDQWVRFLSDGTPVDHSSEMARWDYLKLRNVEDGKPGSINENHPIIKLLRWMDGFKETDEAGVPLKFQKGIYDQNTAADTAKYVSSLTRRTATLMSAHNWLASNGMTTIGEMEGGASLRDAWKESGLGPEGLNKFVTSNYAGEVQQRTSAVLQQADQTGQKITNQAANKQAIESILDEAKINPKAAKGLTAYGDMAKMGMKTPGMLKWWDRYNTTFKNLLYNVWPASHVRDLLSRIWNASVAGKAPLIDMEGGGILGFTHQAIKHFKNMGTPGYETPEFIKEAMDAGMFKNFTAYMVQSNPALWRANKVPQAGFWSSISPFNKGGTWKPWKIPGLGVSDEAAESGEKIFSPILAGMGAQSYGDAVGQFGYFGALRKAGYSVDQAKHLVQEAFYTLGKQTPFEKHFLSRVMPFERFTMRNIPYQLAKLGTEPGGATAQTARALTEASQDKDYKPEFLREGSVIPVGKAKPGEQQAFYRNTLIPLHELNDIVLGKGTWGDMTRTGEKLLSRLNPALLLGMERPWDPEGTQLYTGRKNKDLQSATGIPALDTVAHYSPLSRVVSETEKVPGLNPHENWAEFAANILGLGRMSNYDTERFKSVDLRNALTEAAKEKGARGTEDLFIPADVTKGKTPEQLSELKQEMKRRTGIIKKMQADRKAPPHEQALQEQAPTPWPGFFGGQ